MSDRRPHGAGSLRKEDRAGGKKVWIGAVRLGGRQRQKVLGPVREGRAKDDPEVLGQRGAEDALRAFRVEVEKEAAQEAAERAREDVQEESVGAVGEAYCVAAETRRERKASTVTDYRLYLRLHLVPYFGDRPLREITVEQIEAFMEFQMGESGLARSTVANHVNFLHAIFKRGMRDGIVEANPVTAAERPPTPAPDADFRHLSMEEVEAVIRAVSDDDLGKTDAAIILTAAMTGLRQGELIALRWRDVDFAAGVIRVFRSYSRGRLTTPKSKGSKRSVPMDDQVAAALDRHSKASLYTDEDDLVFAHPHTGHFLDASALLIRFKAALGRAEFEPVRFHDLRHTFATILASSGTPMRTIQEWMGHADIQTTEIYAKYAPDPTGGRIWLERAFSRAENPVLTATADG